MTTEREKSDATSIMSLSEDILFYIIRKCSVRNLGALSSTCKLFNRIVKDELLWKYLCKRDYNLSDKDLVGLSLFYDLYKNVLHKFGWLQGLYQTQNGPYGGLVEVRFNNGKIEGVSWHALKGGVDRPLQSYVLFIIKCLRNSPEFICLPDLANHYCTFTLDKQKGEMCQKCLDPDRHIQAIYNHFDGKQPMQILFLNEVIGQGVHHQPILIPELQDIPEELQLRDGTYPPQLITPGLYKGDYCGHGTELILFKYKDENEIHGIKVTGDPNVFAGKISVKVLLRFPAFVSKDDQRSFDALEAIEPRQSQALISDIQDQSFIVPENCYCGNKSFPNKCKARFHGFGQIAYDDFQQPRFINTHIIVFSSNFFGVLFLELKLFSLYRRVEQSFRRNILPDIESSL